MVGKNQFTFTTKILPTRNALTTRIIVIGNETGGRTEIDVTVNILSDTISAVLSVA